MYKRQGIELPGAGYALYKITKVEIGGKIDEERRKSVIAQLNAMAAQEEVQSYMAALRVRYKVEIDKSALEATKDK